MDSIGSNKRIAYIDMAKGIGVILVILGHTIDGILRGAIYSFHMSLFFILSCATFKFSNSESQFVSKTERAFKHIVVPVVVIWCVRLVLLMVSNMQDFANLADIYIYIKESIISLMFASGIDVPVLSAVIPAMGIPWFFIVLFFGRTILDYIHLKFGEKCVIICVILSIFGICLSKIQYLMLSFDIVFVIMPLLFLGSKFNLFKVENKPFIKFWVYLCVWAISLSISYFAVNDYMEFASRRYPLYPICFITCIAGTMMVVEISVIIENVYLFKPLEWLGNNSLILLCIHMLDMVLFEKIWNITSCLYINAIIRVCINLIVFALVIIIKTMKKHRNI